MDEEEIHKVDEDIADLPDEQVTSDQIFTEKLRNETAWLMDLEEEKRVEYVRETIANLGISIERIIYFEGGFQEKLAVIQQFLAELESSSANLIPPIVYAVKPEFQDVFRDFLKRLVIELPS